MKVKFVSTYPPVKCGIADYTKNLVENLKKIDVKIEIIPIEKPFSKNILYFKRLADLTAEGMGEGDIVHIQFQIFRFGKLLGFLPGFYIISFLKRLKTLTKAKIIITLHDVPSKKDVRKLDFKLGALLNYYKFIYFYLKRYCDGVIVHSENAKRILLNEWKFNRNKIQVISLGLPENVVFLNKEKCKQKIGLKDKKILLLFGYARRYKNYDLVLDAIKSLDKDIVLVITGGIQIKKHKKIYSSFLKKIKEIGLQKRVIVLGFVEEKDLPILLNATNVGILPYTKTFGDFNSAAMAEQLAYQIPILAANIHPFESFKKQYGCIETFDKNNSGDLKKKILEILKNTEKIKILKKKSKQYWEENRWSKIAYIYKKFYSSLN